MAGRQPALLQSGEGSSRSESSFLDHFPGRPLHSHDQENVATVASASLPSSTNSIAAFLSNYDDLSGANPWQDVSTAGPSSPTSQREYYNQHSTHFPSSHFQRDLVAEHPWMQEVLEQQQSSNSSTKAADSARSKAQDDVECQRFSRANLGQDNHTERAGNSIRRRLEQAINPAGSDEQDEAFLYEEAAAAAAWYRCGGLNENLARVEASSDSASAAVPELDHMDATISELARMRWERLGMTNPSGRRREAGDVDTSTVAQPAVGLTKSAKSPDTSLSSETAGGDSDDEEECNKSVDPAGGDGYCSTGKRKTSEVSGEDGDSSKIAEAEVKRTPSSRPRKRSANAEVKLREPRYAIKTRTDVDIMDDGFKWRKYGQKAVKNSPHPRNYYRCTTPHCPVRKRVERSHEDSGLVITTYEGKHAHVTPGFPLPDANSRAVSSGERPLLPGAMFQNPALGLSRNLLPEFAHLAVLHQMRVLRSLQTLAQHQANVLQPSMQWDSLLRAQHWLRLHDAAFGSGSSSSAFGSVKQEPFPFTVPDFMTSRSSHGLPGYPSHPFPLPGSLLLDRMQQFMRAAAQSAPSGSPRQLRPLHSDLESFPDFPSTDCDLVRRVLEAEEQEQFPSGADGPTSNVDRDNIANVDSPAFNYGGAAAAAASPPPPPPVSSSSYASSFRNLVELEHLRASQRPPRALPRRSKAGGSSDNLLAQSGQQPPL